MDEKIPATANRLLLDPELMGDFLDDINSEEEDEQAQAAE